MPDPETLEDLRERARELDVPGRSKMDADQLAGAITIAERKRAEAAAAIDARTSVSTSDQSYPVSRLRAEPVIHGHSTFAFAVALADAGLSDDDELTRSELDALVQRSQERPVQVEEE